MRIASSGNLVSLKNDHVRYRVHSDSVSMRFALDATGGLKEVLSWTQRDPMLSQRCRPFLKYAQAKVAYYEAKAAMSEGQQLSAQSYLRPFAFVNWRYFILYSGTKSFVLWRFLLRFDRRNITS
jgi:hypothetical protein